MNEDTNKRMEKSPTAREGLVSYLKSLSMDNSLDREVVELLSKAVVEKTDGPIIATQVIELISARYAQTKKDKTKGI
ncbi:MAG: hypothetical protein AAB864_00235 [Patescibacteria group bacterium]